MLITVWVCSGSTLQLRWWPRYWPLYCYKQLTVSIVVSAFTVFRLVDNIMPNRLFIVHWPNYKLKPLANWNCGTLVEMSPLVRCMRVTRVGYIYLRRYHYTWVCKYICKYCWRCNEISQIKAKNNEVLRKKYFYPTCLAVWTLQFPYIDTRW